MTYQEEIARRVRPFGGFLRIMTELPSLENMESKQREDLLRDLYRLAGGKALREHLGRTTMAFYSSAQRAESGDF